jgi:hypothetical protein
MRQLKDIQILYAFHFDSLPKNEHVTRTRPSRLSSTDIPALVLRTTVTKMATKWPRLGPLFDFRKEFKDKGKIVFVLVFSWIRKAAFVLRFSLGATFTF